MFGTGRAPIASGTFGSFAALLLFYPIHGLPLPIYLLTTAAVFALGVWAADYLEPIFGKKDDGRIVIDEVVGQWITLLPVLLLPAMQEKKGETIWFLMLVTGFVAFRLFDIWKPGPVRWAERKYAGGLGVMLDDVIAGIFAGVALAGLIEILDRSAIL